MGTSIMVENVDKKDIQSLKSFANPPILGKDILIAVSMLIDLNCPHLSMKDEKNPNIWRYCQKMMASPIQLVTQLKNYDHLKLPKKNYVAVKKCIEKNPDILN